MASALLVISPCYGTFNELNVVEIKQNARQL